MTTIDPNDVPRLQLEAATRCRDTKPISAEEGRGMLAVFSGFAGYRNPHETDV